MFLENTEIVRVLSKSRYVMLKISVDELFENDTPKVNFWTFCITNNLIEQWKVEEGGDDNYYPMVSSVHLLLSEDEKKNERAYKFFKMLEICAI